MVSLCHVSHLHWHLIHRAGRRFFHMNAQGQVQQRQLGVLRTNCMDNLDRTNVVQSLFARRFIMMATGKLAEQTSVLSSRFKSFEKAFKNGRSKS